VRVDRTGGDLLEDGDLDRTGGDLYRTEGDFENDAFGVYPYRYTLNLTGESSCFFAAYIAEYITVILIFHAKALRFVIKGINLEKIDILTAAVPSCLEHL
jgi:hypothetical protein